MSFKSGFVALIGHPNVGKSTLLNTLLGQKIAIVTSKPQTTRNVIRGIYTNNTMQAVFLDTPGIHNAKTKLGNFMNNSAKASYHDVEVIMLVCDAKNENVEDYKGLLEDIIKTNIPLILVLNKIDLLTKDEIIDKIALWSNSYKFNEIIPLSAKKKENCEDVIKIIENYLPEGPMYYPDYMNSDNPESFLISEVVREKIMSFTKDEIPHSVAVICEYLKITKNGIDTKCTIIVERDSQKGIIIGKNGSMIKRIGTSARMDLENIFDTKVRLETFVRVEKDWRNSNLYLKEFGYKKDE